jgi:uncharacterized protein (TIGR03086 family)
MTTDARTTPQTEPVAVDLLDYHQRAGEATRVILTRIRSDQWLAPTNCDMDVRTLVNHLVTGHYWAAALVQGETIADVGDRFDRDMLGTDPVAAYDRALAAAQAAFSRPGALGRTCILSYGEVSVALYCSHRVLDTFIHGWDLARATEQDDTLDPSLVEGTYAMFAPHAAEFEASPAFGPPLRVPADSDMQTRLLAMLGRDNRG